MKFEIPIAHIWLCEDYGRLCVLCGFIGLYGDFVGILEGKHRDYMRRVIRG